MIIAFSALGHLFGALAMVIVCGNAIIPKDAGYIALGGILVQVVMVGLLVGWGLRGMPKK